MVSAHQKIRGEPSKRHARACFSAWGFDVEEVSPVQGQRRADLRVTRAGEEYIVEAKAREENEGWHELVRRARTDGWASIARNIDPWNAISAKIRDAYEQLVATPASVSGFRILWVPALHQDDEFVLDCVEKRLYGLAHLSVVKNLSLEDRPSTKLCYFHGPSDFRRFRGLDAAILCSRAGGRLCVNTFSPNVTRLRTASLYEIFDGKGAVRDPEIHERSGQAYVLDEDFVGEPTGHAAWSYIRNKYGVLSSKMVESAFNGLVIVPTDLAQDQPAADPLLAASLSAHPEK